MCTNRQKLVTGHQRLSTLFSDLTTDQLTQKILRFLHPIIREVSCVR